MGISRDTIELYNGYQLPSIGAGTFPYKKELPEIVSGLIQVGYRLFDTSDSYLNEEFLGKGLSLLDQKTLNETTVITKYSYPTMNVKEAFNTSSHKLFSKTAKPERMADIYLMHWPYPHLWERRWREMEDLYRRGVVHAIGVCNFNERRLKRLLSICRVKPMINQFECHPMFQQRSLINMCENEGIRVMSYSPLARKNEELMMDNGYLKELSEIYGKTVSQVILKWNISEGRIPIPATGNRMHMKENFSLDDFTLSEDEINEINKMEKGLRVRFDPDKRFSFMQRMRFLAYAGLIKTHLKK